MLILQHNVKIDTKNKCDSVKNGKKALEIVAANIKYNNDVKRL